MRIGIGTGVTRLRPAPGGGGGGGGGADYSWSTTDKVSEITLSNSNRTATVNSGGGNRGARSATAIPTSKIYVEAYVSYNTGAEAYFGIGTASASLTSSWFPGPSNTAIATYHSVGLQSPFRINGVANAPSGSPWTSFRNNGTSQICVDRGGANKIWFGWNNTWDGDPAAGTGGYSISGISGDLFLLQVGFYLNDYHTLNLTAAQQTYTAPSGFTAIGG